MKTQIKAILFIIMWLQVRNSFQLVSTLFDAFPKCKLVGAFKYLNVKIQVGVFDWLKTK